MSINPLKNYKLTQYTQEEIDDINYFYEKSIESYKKEGVIQLINEFIKFDENHTIENIYVSKTSAELIRLLIKLPVEIKSEIYKELLSNIENEFNEWDQIYKNGIDNYESSDSKDNDLDYFSNVYATIESLNDSFRDHAYTNLDDSYYLFEDEDRIIEISKMIKFSFNSDDSVFFGNITADIKGCLDFIISEVDQYEKILASYRKKAEFYEELMSDSSDESMLSVISNFFESTYISMYYYKNFLKEKFYYIYNKLFFSLLRAYMIFKRGEVIDYNGYDNENEEFI